MIANSHQGEEADLFSYVVASGDMRFIEIGERDLFLRQDPELGLVIRGEVPECGPGCYANLSQVLLEYVMGCEDCREAALTGQAADHFGQRLGHTLLETLYPNAGASKGSEAFPQAMFIVIASLGAPFEQKSGEDVLNYRLAFCPIHETAQASALNLWIPLAHRAFASLCDSIRTSLAPDWRMIQPAEWESDAPLIEITFKRT